MAASVHPSDVDGVVRKLDLTSFPNSVGPRRMPGKTTFADYGFRHVGKTAEGARLVKDDEGWEMSFSIISAGPTSLRLCFHDKGLRRPGDVKAPSYNATAALLVTKLQSGRWAAKQVPAGFANCRNDPAVA